MIASRESYDEILLCSSQLQNEEQGKLIPEAAVKAKLRDMNSLKLVKSLNDQDLPVLGRVITRVGIPTSSEI